MKLFLFLIFFLKFSYGSKILFLLPISTKSHRNAFDPLIQELANRNHNVTIVVPFSITQLGPNVREIFSEKGPLEPQIFSNNFVANPDNGVRSLMDLSKLLKIMCEFYLTNPEVKELLKQGKQFDLVIVSNVYNECALVTAPLLGKIIMMQASTSLIPWTYSMLPQPPSFVPMNLKAIGSKLNFLQRLDNMISWIITLAAVEYTWYPSVQAVIAKHIPGNPLIKDAQKQVSFILTNADPVITSPRPSIPNIKNLGGMHCRSAKPVPKDFEDFIQTSGQNGFILFSLGSMIQSKDMKNDTVKELLKMFSRLKQNVIWKFEEKPQGIIPKNVKLSKWLPQQDLLGHSKIRLFITHGGMLGLQESVYHAVPVVAIPLFAEQPGNVARVEEIGIGVKVDWLNLTGVSLNEAINKILIDKSFSDNAKKYSEIFRDFNKNQIEKAVYWIEYVIRHDGAQHLRISAAEELNFFQYFLIDVILFVLFVIFVFLFLLTKTGRFLMHTFSKKKQQ